MHKIKKKYFLSFPLFLYSFSLGLGSFNPFSNNVSDWSLSYIFLAFFMFSTICHSNVIGSIKTFKKEILFLILLLFTLFISSLFYSFTNVSIITFNLKFFVSILIFWFISFHFKNDNKIAIMALFFFAIACGIISILSLTGILQNQMSINKGRLILFGENPNSTSIRMALSALFFCYIIIVNPLNFSKLRLFLFLFIFTLLMVVIQSGSRGSLIIFSLGFVIIFLFSEIKLYQKIVVLSIFSIAAAYILKIIISIGDFAIFDRMSGFFDSGSIGGRKEIWIDALKIFIEHPIIGVGEEGYVIEMLSRNNYFLDTHNLFVYILVTSGIVGFLFFISFLFLILSKAWKSYRAGEIFPMVLFVFIVLTIFKTGGVLTYSIIWFLFAFVNTYKLKKNY